MTEDRLSRVFGALADPTRRDIVARLAVGDATVGQLAEPYDVSVQAVSKHVKVLEDAGLVTRSRDAQRRPCHLEAEVFDLMTKWIERYRRAAEERFRRLDAVLAAMDGDTDDPNTDQGDGSIMSAPTKHETTIEADPKLPTIRIVREFDAPPERVFRALDRPRAVRRSGSGRDEHRRCSSTTGTRAPAAATGTRAARTRERVRRSAARSTRCAPNERHRADVHLRGRAGRRRPGDA